MEIKLKNLALEAAGSTVCVTALKNPNFTLDTTLADIAHAYFKQTDSEMSASKQQSNLNSIRFSTKQGEVLLDLSTCLRTLFSEEDQIKLNFELAIKVRFQLAKDYSGLSLLYPLPPSDKHFKLDESDEKTTIFPGDLVQEVIERIEKLFGYAVDSVIAADGQSIDAKQTFMDQKL